MKKHVNNLASRTSFRLAGISRIKDNLSKKQLHQLVDSLVMSLVRYALELTATNQGCLKKLQAIQNRALRVATGSPKERKISDMLKETKWLSVTNLMRLQQIQAVMNILKNRTCRMCIEMVDLEKRLQQERYSLRMKDLKIAWHPNKARTETSSAWIRMTKTFNSCDMLSRKMPKTKSSQQKVMTNALMSIFGRSHKP